MVRASEIAMDMTPSKPVSIFLCHATEDADAVLTLYAKLEAQQFRPWMDRKDLVPGEEWERAIWKAVRQADFFVVCLSERSVTKRSFLQREIKKAITIWEEKLVDDIYLIPARLTPCEMPSSLSHLQWVNLYEPDGFDKLTEAILLGAKRRGLLCPVNQHDRVENQLSIKTKRLEDQQSHYNIEVEYPQIISDSTSTWIKEINLSLSGFAVKQLLEHRKYYVAPLEERIARLYPTKAPTSYMSMSYGVSIFDHNLISIGHSISWYSAGAAHPNNNIATQTYQLSPALELELRDFFQPNSGYLEAIAELCRADLIRQAYEEYGEDNHFSADIPKGLNITAESRTAYLLKNYWRNTWLEGVAPNKDNFRSYTIKAKSIEFLFPPYQVGPYTWGSRSVNIPYANLDAYLDKDGPLCQVLKTH